MNKRILVVEDSQACQVIARESLKTLGEVDLASNFEAAADLLEANLYSVILIDINLPDRDGFECLGNFLNDSRHAQVPMVFVSADHEVSKKVAVFSLGARDYVTKPYSPLELRARVERLLRSNSSADEFSDQASGIKLNTTSYKAVRAVDGKLTNLDLTPNEFKILQLLIRHPERIYSRDQIINYVWGSQVFLSERTVDTHVSTLRRKLKDLSLCLRSVRGEGYCWIHSSAHIAA